LGNEYAEARAEHRVAYARAFLSAQGTVKDREAEAMLATANEFIRMEAAEQGLKAARERVQTLRTQIGAGQSIGAAIRAEIGLAGAVGTCPRTGRCRGRWNSPLPWRKSTPGWRSPRARRRSGGGRRQPKACSSSRGKASRSRLTTWWSGSASPSRPTAERSGGRCSRRSAKPVWSPTTATPRPGARPRKGPRAASGSARLLRSGTRREPGVGGAPPVRPGADQLQPAAPPPPAGAAHPGYPGGSVDRVARRAGAGAG